MMINVKVALISNSFSLGWSLAFSFDALAEGNYILATLFLILGLINLPCLSQGLK